MFFACNIPIMYIHNVHNVNKVLSNLLSIPQNNASITREFFTCQAEFHGTIFNATKRCRIMNNDKVKQLEFAGIDGNIDVSIDVH